MTIFRLFIQRNTLPIQLFSNHNRLYSYVSFVCKLCFIFLVFSVQASMAQGDRWFFVSRNADNEYNYIDKTTIEKEKNNTRLWAKTIYSDGSYRINLMNWKCSARHYFLATSTIYDERGKRIDHEIINERFDILPDSVAEAIFNIVCKADSLKAIPDKTSVRVSSKMANVRESPAMDSAVIGTATRGKIFRLVTAEPQNDWYRIYFTKDEIAWIHQSTVE